MQKLTTFLWFDGVAEQAAKFYTTVFGQSRILSTMPGRDRTPMGITFELMGREFIAFNGGPAQFTFNESISFFISCDTQNEIDELWEKLSAGGLKSRCGWLQDQFGVWWQIVPSVLGKLMADPDRSKAGRVMQALMKMDKLDIAALKQAADGR